MKVVGIIAEFNPFHNGHKYLIEQAKALTGADYCVIVMSGSFTQRGTPACMSKQLRTHSALDCGADLVLELPFSYATSTAESFCYGGVSILHALGIIDYLAFGSEEGSIDKLTECLHAISNITPQNLMLINKYLTEGMSYPAARSKVFPEYSAILNEPNNILAIEYLKALDSLNSAITPITIKRLGTGYHDLNISDYASADAIRNRIGESENYEFLKDAIPTELYSKYIDAIHEEWPIELNDYNELIKYMLLTKSEEELAPLQDMNIDIARRFKNNNDLFSSINDYLAKIKTKELTYTRYNRALIHCLLNTTDMTRSENGTLIPCPYTRILGFNKNAGELMHTMVQAAKLPLINKAADAYKLLSPEVYPYFQLTLKSDDLYDLVLHKKYGTRHTSSILLPPVIK